MIGTQTRSLRFSSFFAPTCSPFNLTLPTIFFTHKKLVFLSPILPRDLSLTLSTPGLETENRWGLRSTTCRGDSPAPRGLLEAPLDGCAVIHVELWVLSLSLSLSRWRRVFVYLWRYGRNLGQILRELPEASEVATNQ